VQPAASINNKQTHTLQVSPLNKLYNTYIFKQIVQIRADRTDRCEIIIRLSARERYFLAIYDIYNTYTKRVAAVPQTEAHF